MSSVKQLIEERAYHLFLKRGGVQGYALEDWFQAEKDVLAELDSKKKAAAPAASAVKTRMPDPKPAKSFRKR
jgi:hypothetical protein